MNHHAETPATGSTIAESVFERSSLALFDRLRQRVRRRDGDGREAAVGIRLAGTAGLARTDEADEDPPHRAPQISTASPVSSQPA